MQNARRFGSACRPHALTAPQRALLAQSLNRFVTISLILFCLLVGAAGTGSLVVLEREAAPVPELGELRSGTSSLLAHSTRILDANGNEIGRWFEQDRTWVRLEEIAEPVVDALIATEDHRFENHRGIDYRRLVSAVYHTLHGSRQGASTLSMQLARNLYPDISGATPLRRKLREIATARALERELSKDQILELYLNTVPFGQRAYGIEAAAQAYFSISANELSTLQAATLVALLRGPSFYNPHRHPERTRARRATVLNRMVETGKLGMNERPDDDEALGLAPRQSAETDSIAPHFLDRVRQQVRSWAAARDIDPGRAGLRIHTTLDPELQRKAVASLEKRTARLQEQAAAAWETSAHTSTGSSPESTRAFPGWWDQNETRLLLHLRRTGHYQNLTAQGYSPDEALERLRANTAVVDSIKFAATRLDAGLVAIHPTTGAVRAYVGGRAYDRDAFDKVSLARRQLGSTFKPFAYAAAMERGLSPYDLVQDSVRTYPVSGGPDWRPRNVGGYATNEPFTLREALALSKNTVAAKVGATLGADVLADAATRAGIKSPQRPHLSLVLGTSEASLLELATAYTTLANNGRHNHPHLISRIEDGSGHVLKSATPDDQQTISPYAAYLTVDMLRDAVTYGTAAEIRRSYQMPGDLAAKTGTTQHGADGWFVLMHPALVAASWVGFNDPAVRFRSAEDAQGSRTALPIVADFFERAFAENPQWAHERFRAPRGHHIPHPAFLREDQPSQSRPVHLPTPASIDSTVLARLQRVPMPASIRTKLFPEEGDDIAKELALHHATDDVMTLLRDRMDQGHSLLRRDSLAMPEPTEPDAEAILRRRLYQ